MKSQIKMHFWILQKNLEKNMFSRIQFQLNQIYKLKHKAFEVLKLYYKIMHPMCDIGWYLDRKFLTHKARRK